MDLMERADRVQEALALLLAGYQPTEHDIDLEALKSVRIVTGTVAHSRFCESEPRLYKHACLSSEEYADYMDDGVPVDYDAFREEYDPSDCVGDGSGLECKPFCPHDPRMP